MPISVHHRGGWSYGTVSDEEKIRIRDNVASDNEMNNLYN